MIEWQSFAPATNLDPHGSSVSVEYTTNGESDYAEMDEQIIAMFMGYL